MKRERVNRFKYILSSYAETMRKDQCMTQLLRLRTTSFDDFGKHLYRELRKMKELIFMPSKVSTKQADTMTTKALVFDLFAEWFYEYNSQSSLKLVEYAIKVCVMNNDNVSFEYYGQFQLINNQPCFSIIRSKVRLILLWYFIHSVRYASCSQLKGKMYFEYLTLLLCWMMGWTGCLKETALKV